jgi:hypothetical protein
MTRDDRSSPREREQIQPDGLAARTRDLSPADAGPVDSSSAPRDSARKLFNPWRFGFHTVSADHRRELLEMELPETPPERLFDQQELAAGNAELSASAPPALTVDAEREPPAGDDHSRKSDTLRLRQGPPLVHPLRLAGTWVGIAALVVAGVLWLIFRGVTSPSASSATVAKPSTPAPTPASATAPTSPTAATSSSTTLPPKTGEATQRAESVSSANQKPEVSPLPAGRSVVQATPLATTANAASEATVPSPAKPKGATSDDDASPFGHWTTPPRDN